MSKVTIAAGAALITVLGVQQYQLGRITDEIAEIKAEVRSLSVLEPGSFSDEDEKCLAKNIYYEAGVESEHGKKAVAQVTLNRMRTGRWGKTICQVVYAKAQFSWTMKKKLEEPKGNAWADSQWIAHRVLRGDALPKLETALFYHADYVKPSWRNPVAKIQQIGAHIFYASAKVKIVKA
jgi:spore germination cell wall hydrolase CwlJ-like protein